jgi:hypothetical protein
VCCPQNLVCITKISFYLDFYATTYAPTTVEVLDKIKDDDAKSRFSFVSFSSLLRWLYIATTLNLRFQQTKSNNRKKAKAICRIATLSCSSPPLLFLALDYVETRCKYYLYCMCMCVISDLSFRLCS